MGEPEGALESTGVGGQEATSQADWFENMVVTGDDSLAFIEVSQPSLWRDYSISIDAYEVRLSNGLEWELKNKWLMKDPPENGVIYLTGSYRSIFDRRNEAIYLSFRSELPLTEPIREVPLGHYDYYPYLVKIDKGEVRWIIDNYFYRDGSVVGDIVGVDDDGFIYTYAYDPDEATDSTYKYKIVKVLFEDSEDDVVWSRFTDYADHVVTSRAGSTYTLTKFRDRSSNGFNVTVFDADGEYRWTTNVDMDACNNRWENTPSIVPAHNDTAVYVFAKCLVKLDGDGEVVWMREHGLQVPIDNNLALSVDGNSVYVLGRPAEGAIDDRTLFRFAADTGEVMGERQFIGGEYSPAELKPSFSGDSVFMIMNVDRIKRGVYEISNTLQVQQVL